MKKLVFKKNWRLPLLGLHLFFIKVKLIKSNKDENISKLLISIEKRMLYNEVKLLFGFDRMYYTKIYPKL